MSRYYGSFLCSYLLNFLTISFEQCVDKMIERMQSDGETGSSIQTDYLSLIGRDPICHLALLFAALSHDCAHRGIPNQGEVMAEEYGGRCISEQQSLNRFWTMFMSDDFQTLRTFVFADSDELVLFRQCLVNMTIASTIADETSQASFQDRWEKAFGTKATPTGTHLRATVVLELLMQASRIGHTMQHWHIFQKWNERLYQEKSLAYKQGNATDDPSGEWYKKELAFFDDFVIPIAEKIRDCQVFGDKSDECFGYANKNRDKFEANGEDIVSEMVALCAESQKASQPMRGRLCRRYSSFGSKRSKMY